MLAPTYTETEKLLLDLADVVEKSTTYNQRRIMNDCGTPGCAWGHLVRMRPKLGGRLVEAFRGTSPLALSSSEAHELFGSPGCGNAGTDGRKAAVYLRDFVARKVRQRLEAE